MDQKDIYDHLYPENEIEYHYKQQLYKQAEFYENEIRNLREIKYEGSEFTINKNELSYNAKDEQRKNFLRHADALKDAKDEIFYLEEGNKKLRAELERLRANVDKILDEENKALQDQVVTLLEDIKNLHANIRGLKRTQESRTAHLEDEKKRLEKAKTAYLDQCHRAEERLSFLGRTIADMNKLVNDLTETNKNLRDKITKEEDRLKNLPTESRDKARKLDL